MTCGANLWVRLRGKGGELGRRVIKEGFLEGVGLVPAQKNYRFRLVEGIRKNNLKEGKCGVL